ncbi:putative superfamily III holin-X [Mucilaginibacter gracilis]|uniref:Putative superfamily III holin-X n=1 Tax=Mucilaginibacter gracilis TaxID=423350 RepID=A0A495IXH1_9SPHI|nr:phage holin family protein [Mucilaginibacter gracilis]RKR81396.1 putative superfamily III holin-X [Mucilaginibacter gracilis]
MEEQKEEQPGLTDQLKEYVETRIKLARYQAIDKGTSFFANLITEVFVLICMGLTFFFATITLALFLGHLIGSYWIGFGLVALLYLILAIAVSYTKDKYLEPRIINFLLRKIFKPKK